jgi:hypothetical protein
VWSVVPGARAEAERRAGYDRRSPDPVLLYKGHERRVSPDRRAGRAPVSPEMRQGRLIFESASERRRLAPIPPAWERYTDEALDRLSQMAHPRQADRREHENNAT